MNNRDPFAVSLEPVRPKRRNRLHGLGPAQPPEEQGDLECALQPMNDLGNAHRLMLRNDGNLIWVENRGWLVWDGVRWNGERGKAEAIKRAQKVSRAIEREWRVLQTNGYPADQVEQARMWSRQSGNYPKVLAMLSSAEPHLAEKLDSFDANEFLVATPNGTIELGPRCVFRASRREDRITRILGVAFNKQAQCPEWEIFLKQIIPDERMRRFLQRALGYCLTGSIREHKMFLFFGTGRNGKSTLMNVLRSVAGEYAMGAPVTTFLANPRGNSGGEPSPDLARLPGARLVMAAEPQETARLDESKVKEITGGDVITVRNLNQGFFEYRPSFKVMICTNYLPTIRGTDHGIWSRILVFPFGVQIPESQIDRDLEQKLLAEKEGILQWLLAGAEEWFEKGLMPPESALAAINQYRADQDPVGEFLKACCEICPESINPSTGKPYEVTAKRLREGYVEWCKQEGLDPIAGRTFGMRIRARGIDQRKSKGYGVWVGLHLNSEPT